MSLSNKSPRILYVTRPWAPSGAQERCIAVHSALQQMGAVEVFVLNNGDPNDYSLAGPKSTFQAEYMCRRVPRLNEPTTAKVRRKLNPRSDYPDGWKAPDEARHNILARLDSFDLIWFFKLGCADMFPNAPWPRSVLDIDDVPSACEATALKAAAGLRPQLVALMRMTAWRKRERLLAERFTVLTVCSEEDKVYLQRVGLKAPIHVVPNGFEKPSSEPVCTPARPPRIGFIGHFSHFPNYEGIHWFVRNCWPLIKREIGDARLRLVGPCSEGALKPSGADVEALGWLANPVDEIKTWSLMVVPIRLGGGTRVKIAQAFSQKCPVVSTSFGAQGFLSSDGHAMYIADSPGTFSRACISAIRQPAMAAQMAETAWHEFLKRWTWDAIRPRIWAAAEDCLRLNHRHRTSITPGSILLAGHTFH